MNKSTITIAELFGPVLQGEGPLIGMPTVFVRTGGCDFRCAWCDSMYAVDHVKHGDEWEEMDTDAVMDRILDLSGGYPMLVTLSGGNPAQQPLGALVNAGHEIGYTFALETQGTITQEWFNSLDHLVLSPKPPSSGMHFSLARVVHAIEVARRGQSRPMVSIKLVIFSEEDYQFARQFIDWFPIFQIYLQAGTEQHGPGVCEASELIEMRSDILRRMKWLAERVTADHWNDVRVLPQLHALMYGDRRGV